MSEPEDRVRLGLQRFWAALMMAVGGIIATLCGGCALVIAASLMTSPGLETLPMLLVPAVLGGLPALLGWVIFRSGLKLYRRSAPNRNVSGTFD